MTPEEFYEHENPENNDDYNSNVNYWYFSKEEMILFAKRYASHQPEVDGNKELNISYACFSNNAKNVINIEPLDKFTQVSISKSELPTLISWLKKQL